jgi:hypothetical protein
MKLPQPHPPSPQRHSSTPLYGKPASGSSVRASSIKAASAPALRPCLPSGARRDRPPPNGGEAATPRLSDGRPVPRPNRFPLGAIQASLQARQARAEREGDWTRSLYRGASGGRRNDAERHSCGAQRAGRSPTIGPWSVGTYAGLAAAEAAGEVSNAEREGGGLASIVDQRCR